MFLRSVPGFPEWEVWPPNVDDYFRSMTPAAHFDRSVVVPVPEDRATHALCDNKGPVLNKGIAHAVRRG